jgi:Holliday junction resolvase RusA-like endonuclease
MSPIKFTILGEPASKANSRDIVKIAGRPASIKSEKARDFEANALRQIPPAARVRIACPVRVTLHIFYASERPDLDESVVLDVLQDRHKSIKLTKADRELGVKPQRLLIQKGVYVNDRLVREKHVYHGIDKKNPRVEVMVEPIDGRQGELLGVSA